MLMTLNFYRTTNKGTDLNNFFDSISVHLTTVSSMSDQSIRSALSLMSPVWLGWAKFCRLGYFLWLVGSILSVPVLRLNDTASSLYSGKRSYLSRAKLGALLFLLGAKFSTRKSLCDIFYTGV